MKKITKLQRTLWALDKSREVEYTELEKEFNDQATYYFLYTYLGDQIGFYKLDANEEVQCFATSKKDLYLMKLGRNFYEMHKDEVKEID